MHEITPSTSGRTVRFYLLLLASLVGGALLGAFLFPRSIERTVYRDVEKPVPYAVETIKEVRVPFEVIRYVDREVVKVVEKPVISYVEVPLRVDIRYVSENARNTDGKASYVISPERLAMWRQVKPGMNRKDVIDILGPPSSTPSRDYQSGRMRYSWYGGLHADSGSVTFEGGGDGRVVEVKIPEY
jgi:hypothetical protein